MHLGIVGHEAKKFTPETQRCARRIIRSAITNFQADLVVSGHSPLGGIDWWAIEEAQGMGVETREHPPGVLQWHGVAGVDGFMERNLKIAADSALVLCIVVQELPPDYRGMEFADGCYHCKTPPADHIKSGGCWTVKAARRLGKPTVTAVVDSSGGFSCRNSNMNSRPAPLSRPAWTQASFRT